MYTSYYNYLLEDYYSRNQLLSQSPIVVNEKRWKLIEPPVGQAVTTAEAKLYGKIENTIEDTLVDSFIKMATFYAERYMKRAILRQKWSMFFDWIPYSDSIEITPSGYNVVLDKINYYDLNNNVFVWNSANYFFDNLDDINPARINLNYNSQYPVDMRNRASFEVLFFTGWTLPADVPEDIKTAIKIIVQNFYEDREGVMSDKEGALYNGDHGAGGLPIRAMKLLSQYRVYRI